MRIRIDRPNTSNALNSNTNQTQSFGKLGTGLMGTQSTSNLASTLASLLGLKTGMDGNFQQPVNNINYFIMEILKSISSNTFSSMGTNDPNLNLLPSLFLPGSSAVNDNMNSAGANRINCMFWNFFLIKMMIFIVLINFF